MIMTGSHLNSEEMSKVEIIREISDDLGRGGWSKASTVRLKNGTMFLGKPLSIDSSEVRNGEWFATIQFHNALKGREQWCSLDDISSVNR